MSSFQKYFSKKPKNQSWLKTFLENVSKNTFEEYFRNVFEAKDGSIPPHTFIEKREKPSNRVIQNLKKENEVKRKLFISFSRTQGKPIELGEFLASYEEKFGKLSSRERLETSTGSFEDYFIISDNAKEILYAEIKEKIKKAYFEEFRSFLLQTLKSINRHFDHEFKQACTLFNEDKRSRFRSLCGFNLKSLDDTDISVINTTDNYSINFKQNHNEQGIYRWAC